MPRPPPEHDLAAVAALAARLGVDGRPELIRAAKHTAIRLGSLAARVQSAGRLDQALAAMQREVSVARHLAELGAPITPPSRALSPGPYAEADCAITLWEFVSHRPAVAADAAEAGVALWQVHKALASYAGELPPFTDATTSCAALLADPDRLAASSADLALLRELYAEGVASLEADGAGWAPLHGDAHLGNVLVTETGPIWGDLEAVCRGPLAWDLTNKPPDFLAPFGPLDLTRLDRLSRFRRVCVAIWCWADADRSPELRQAAEFHTRALSGGRA